FPTRISWRVIQGFEAQADASRAAGMGCVEVRTDPILHDPVPDSRLPAEELAAKLARAGDAQLPSLLLAARIELARPEGAGAIARPLTLLVRNQRERMRPGITPYPRVGIVEPAGPAPNTPPAKAAPPSAPSASATPPANR